MESVNQTIRDKMIKHQVGLLRLSDAVSAKLITLLNRTEDDILAQLSKKLGNQRLDAILASIRNILNAARPNEYEMMQKELTNLAKYESDFTKKLVEGPLPVKFEMASPSVDQLSSIVTSEPFQGKLLKEWTEELTDSRRKLIRDAVRIGMVQGQTIDQIARRIRGTKANQYKDGLMEISRRGAQAMTRTAVNHTASMARRNMFEKNTDIIKGEQYVATLDARTTPLCQALDGKVFKIGEAPVPGRDTHIGCRSCLVPVLKTWREIGIDMDELPESTRASFDGQVPESTTYNDWLKRQDPKLQDDILGPARAKMFRDGVPVDKFVDIKTGKQFTLNDLEKMDL